MKTKIRTGTVALMAWLTFAAIATALVLKHQTNQFDSNVEKLERMVRQSTGTVEVRGTIVDQAGMALGRVGIEVAEVDPTDIFGNLRNREVLTVDGSFEIERTGVEAIDCGFFKEGYYDVRRSFSVSGTALDSHGSTLDTHDVVIVMLEIPDPAPLKKFEGYLSSDGSGRSSVLSLADPSSRVAIESPHLYLEPKIESDGSLSGSVTELEGMSGPQKVLKSGRVRFSHPKVGDGFIATNVKSVVSPAKYGFREMNSAPIDGYSENLAISGESGEENTFFYFRVDQKYGKGVVTNKAPIVDLNGVETAGARIIIYLNPTGSRDVSFIHF